MKGKDLAGKIEFDLCDGYELKAVCLPADNGSEQNIVLLNHNTERVSYFINVKEIKWHIKELPLKPLCSIEIWRARTGEDNQISRNLAESIVFKHLVHNNNIVIGNSKQIREVRRMWEGIMFTAMQTAQSIVALLDTESKEMQLTTHERQLHSQLELLWGEQNIHQRYLGVIAKI